MKLHDVKARETVVAAVVKLSTHHNIPGLSMSYHCDVGRNHFGCQATWCRCPCHEHMRDVSGRFMGWQ